MRISGLIISAVLSVSRIVSAGSVLERVSVSVRNNGLAGSGLALNPNFEAMYLNPAGLTEVEQSILNQGLAGNNGGDLRFTQNFLLHIGNLPKIGAGFDMPLAPRPDSLKNSLTGFWFGAFKLKWLSLGVSSGPGFSVKDCRAGGIISVPLNFPLSRIGIGFLTRGFSFPRLITDGFDAPMGRDSSAGLHLQFGRGRHSLTHLTADTVLQDGVNALRFGRGRSLLGLEHNLIIGRFELAGRIGADVAPGERSLFAGGAGIRLDFMEFNAAVRETAFGNEFSSSLLFRLASKGRLKKAAGTVTESLGTGWKVLLNYYDIPIKFSGVCEEDSGRFVFQIKIRTKKKIDYWHLRIVAEDTFKVVRSFDDLGMPPENITFAYGDLPVGEYRAELSVIADGGKRSKIARIALIREDTEIKAVPFRKSDGRVSSDRNES